MNAFWVFNFFRESYAELKKSTWLSRDEMIKSTAVVVILVVIVAVFVGSVDFVLSRAMSFILAGR